MYCITSCDKSDESEVVVSLDNAFEYGYCKPGDILDFNVVAFTKNAEINRLEVYSSDLENGEKLLLDTILNENPVRYCFVYKVPEFKTDSIKLTLSFNVTDNLNVSQSMSKLIIVSGSKLLEEHSGVKLYSGGRSGENVLNLNDMSRVYDYSTADTSQIDVYDYFDINIYGDNLSREWRTKTDVEFVKSNNFDYPSATSRSITQTFENSKKSSLVSDIKSGDVIILGKSGKAWGVFHVVNINDEANVENDFYVINYKKI